VLVLEKGIDEILDCDARVVKNEALRNKSRQGGLGFTAALRSDFCTGK
jgi:hypothetical protein